MMLKISNMKGGNEDHNHSFSRNGILDLDARLAQSNSMLVWLCILGIPLVLWSKGVLKEIKNALGIFHEVDLSC